MSEKTTEFGGASGYSSNKGYEYQRAIAAYYMVVKEVREIEYEADGEDISIINENKNRKSIEYIQAKFLDIGSFTLSMFVDGVFPQLWNAFDLALKQKQSKGIYCSLYTNIAMDKTLRDFIDSCEKLREQGWQLDDLEKNLNRRCNHQYQKMREDKDRKMLQRFLWGLRVSHTFPLEYVETEIIGYIKSCGIPEPHNKLKLITSYISKVGQGLITRRNLEDLIEYPLTPARNASKMSYTDDDIKVSLKFLADKRVKYGIDDEFPDTDGITRDRTSGLAHAVEVVKYAISEKSRTGVKTSEEALDIIDSDLQKIREDASEIADMEFELWKLKKKYTQRIISIEKTASEFELKW